MMQIDQVVGDIILLVLHNHEPLKKIGIEEDRISIKAKTEDFLGYIGSSSGWSCQSIVTLIKDA